MWHSSRRLGQNWTLTLLSNKCWTLQSQRTRKCEITTLYWCTGRLFRAATRAQRQLLWSLNYLLKRILWKYSIQSLKTADSVLLSLFMIVIHGKFLFFYNWSRSRTQEQTVTFSTILIINSIDLKHLTVPNSSQKSRNWFPAMSKFH